MKQVIVGILLLNLCMTQDVIKVEYGNHSHFKSDFPKYQAAFDSLKQRIATEGTKFIGANKYSEVQGQDGNDLILIKLLNQNVNDSDHVIVIFKIGNLDGSIKDGLRISFKDEDLVKSANLDELLKSAHVLSNDCPLPIYKATIPENIKYCTTYMKSAENIVAQYTKAENITSDNDIKGCIEKYIQVKQPTDNFKCFNSGLTAGWEKISKEQFAQQTAGLQKGANGEYTKVGAKTENVVSQKDYNNSQASA